MKKLIYMVITLFLVFSGTSYVMASCTNEEIKELKSLAKDIKITYKHRGKVIIDDVADYSQFDVTVKNLNEDFYVIIAGGLERLESDNGSAQIILSNGNWDFEVNSKRCEVKIDEIKVFLPRFNVYSLDPLCDGIDGDDFALCGKYYEYSVNYESFKERVTNYRNMHSISNDGYDVDDKNVFEKFLDAFISFANKYKWYIAGGLGLLVIALILLIMGLRKRKLGVLE